MHAFDVASKLAGQLSVEAISEPEPSANRSHQRTMTTTFYRRFDCFVLLLAGAAGDLALRRATFILPWYVFQYGSSMLWAVAVYGVIGLLLPRRRPGGLAVAAALVAAVIELSRLVHTPAFDALRMTFTGRFLLGRFFDPLDLLACWLAIAVTALFDRFILQPNT
jgi:hypothetical protein